MMYAFLGLLVVLLIGFCVVVWKAAPNWRWYNIVAVCITMLLAVLFLFPTAGVLKSRAAWHQVKEKLEDQMAEVAEEHRLIKYGDPDDAEYGQGVMELSMELSKLGIEAGRRWRNLQFQGVNNNQITLVQPQAGAAGGVEGIPAAADEGAAAAAPAQPEPLVPDGLVVYGFAERPMAATPNAATPSAETPSAGTPNAEPVLLPTFYLGEFRVVAGSPNSVTLAPTGPLEQNQMQAIGNQQALSWSLYELLPLDAHEPFVAAGSEESEDNFFGRIDSDLVNRMFGNRVSAETLQEYLQDGRRATDDDPPLSRWWKIEFIKDHSIVVDSPEQRGALDGGFFDGNGRAVDGRLQRADGDEVQFKKGDQILVKEEAANQLISELGVAELRDRFFLRPLNDYRYILRRIRLQLTELANRQSELEFEKKVLEEAISKTEGMLVENQAIKLKLEQDLAQFRVEKNAINDYTEQLRQQVNAMRAEMARLHQQNLALEQEIEAKQLAIQRRLDSLTLVK
jgi:hypothetical protein